jgi:biopolymer transport protein ExbB/TolQ
MGKEIKSSSCFIKYFIIILLPLAFVLFLGANFYGFLGVANITPHIFYTILVIFFIFLLFVPHNAYIAECRIKNQFRAIQNELETSIENTSLTIKGKTKSVLNIREFLEEYFKDIRNDNFARIASSTFPMLGILGTFIAIAISMPDFTVTNSKELDNQISKLLGGVGTAFYASIFGIFLSLLWNFFERYGLSKIESLTSSIEKIYNPYIWSQKELVMFQYDNKHIIENEFTKSLKEIFNLDFIKDINKEHLQTYEKIISQTQMGLKDIENSLVHTSNVLIHNIKQLGVTSNSIEATKTLENNIEQFNKSARELKNLLTSFDNVLDIALMKIDNELAESVMHIEQIVKSVKELK